MKHIEVQDLTTEELVKVVGLLLAHMQLEVHQTTGYGETLLQLVDVSDD